MPTAASYCSCCGQRWHWLRRSSRPHGPLIRCGSAPRSNSHSVAALGSVGILSPLTKNLVRPVACCTKNVTCLTLFRVSFHTFPARNASAELIAGAPSQSQYTRRAGRRPLARALGRTRRVYEVVHFMVQRVEAHAYLGRPRFNEDFLFLNCESGSSTKTYSIYFPKSAGNRYSTWNRRHCPG